MPTPLLGSTCPQCRGFYHSQAGTVDTPTSSTGKWALERPTETGNDDDQDPAEHFPWGGLTFPPNFLDQPQGSLSRAPPPILPVHPAGLVGPACCELIPGPCAGPARLTCQREAQHIGCHIDGGSPLHCTGPCAMARAVLSCCHDVIGEDVLLVPGSDHT